MRADAARASAEPPRTSSPYLVGGALGLFSLVCLLTLVFLGGVFAHRKQLSNRARFAGHLDDSGRVSRTVRTRATFFPDGFFEFLKPGARVRAAAPARARDALDDSDARRESLSTLASEQQPMSTLQRASAVNQSDARRRRRDEPIDLMDGFARGCSDSALSTDESQRTSSSTLLPSAANSVWSSQCALVPTARPFAVPLGTGVGYRANTGDAVLDASSQPLLGTSGLVETCGTPCSLNMTRIPPLEQMLEPDASYLCADVTQSASCNRAHSLQLALTAASCSSCGGGSYGSRAPNESSSSAGNDSTGSSSPSVGCLFQ